MAGLPWLAAADGIRLRVRLQPGTRVERVMGLVADADGAHALKIAVTAPAEKGRANDALLRLLARLLRVPTSALHLVLGAADRRKLVSIAGDPAEIVPRMREGLRPWLKPH
jgi:uncharacterized protein (TIGR00251 family)